MMSIMSSPNPKLSIGLEPAQLETLAEAVRLRALRQGVTKPKMSAILRDVLMAWAQDERKASGEGASLPLFESNDGARHS